MLSQKPKETLYAPVLLACALAEPDELGRFQQKSVEEPLTAILRGKRYKATTYAFHVNEFVKKKRGRVLEKSGETSSLRNRSTKPMMQPYVILKALNEGIIDESIS
ncbi:MAG: hypothetical protein HC871_05650 [Rhizobiales bacterium]|nr:hypothetical protein [Hyphomicrobiales bacterium]